MSAHRSRRRARGFAAAVLLLCATLPAQAQDPTHAQNAAPDGGVSDDAIIVQGLKTKAMKKAIGGFVRGLTVMNSTGPLSRYEPGVYCPAVLGLSHALDDQIAARMRQVATAAGVRPAPPGCRTSALVFFVDNKPAFLKEFRRQQPAYFKDPKGDLWSPPRESGPAVSWQLTQQLDPQGNTLGRDPETGVRYVESVEGGSRITSMITLAVAMSVVIVERKALLGLSTTQIADYALMRSLTDRGPENLKDTKRFSVLGVIDAPMGSETPASLTRWDLAYIKGRYDGDPRFFGNKQGATIRASIERALTGKQQK